MILDKIDELLKEVQELSAQNAEEVEQLRLKYLSKKGEMTALMNDGDPTLVFAQQVYALGKPHDTLLALSTSGNSANVVRAAEVAKALDMQVIAVTGEKGGALAKLADIVLALPETETYKVQELTLPLYHALCLMLEEHFFVKN